MHRNRRGGGVMHRIPAFPSRVWTPFGAVTIHNFYTAMPPVQCPYSAHTVPVQCPYSGGGMHRNRRGGGVMHRIPAFPSRVWTPFGAVTIHNFYTAMPPVQCPYSAHTVPVQCPYSARPFFPMKACVGAGAIKVPNS